MSALQSGRYQEADRLYRRLLRASAEDADALHGLAVVQLQLGQPARALGFLDRALRVAASSQLHNNRATALNALGRPEEALASLERAVALAPDDAALHYNRGRTLMDLQRHADALACLDRALVLDPGLLPAWQNKAVTETRLGLHAAALATSERLVALSPDEAGPRQARGDALLGLHRPAEAALAFDGAARREPALTLAYVNKAFALHLAGRNAEALAAADQALSRDPDCVLAHWNAASICLAAGDYPRGWREFEWRWRKPDFARHLRRLDRPLWTGAQDLAGRTILLHAEQGFGDTVQFCRYVPMVAALGARVVLEAYPPLRALLATLAGADTLIERGDRLPAFDLHCPLMSLPLAFATTLASVPAALPYLATDPERVAAWRARLGPAGAPRIGLAWSGAPGFSGDAVRSAPLDALAGLVRPGFEWVSVQRDVRPQDAEAAARLGIRLTGDAVADFADAAALTALMDLVISVDSAPAHLAGALGRPLWLLLPQVAEWRWLEGRPDSPWYPGARLFRQRAAGGWSALAERVGACLEETASGPF